MMQSDEHEQAVAFCGMIVSSSTGNVGSVELSDGDGVVAIVAFGDVGGTSVVVELFSSEVVVVVDGLDDIGGVVVSVSSGDDEVEIVWTVVSEDVVVVTVGSTDSIVVGFT